MSTTGGGAATVVDRLGTMNVDVVSPPDSLVEGLAARGVTIPKGPLTDLTHAGTRADVYGAVLDELIASDHCDLVLAIAGSSAQFQPEISVGPLIRAAKSKPVAAFLAPHAEAGLAQLAEAGVAGFRTPESCADAIRAWSRWLSPTQTGADVGTAAIDAVEQELAKFQGRRPNEMESASVFNALGVKTSPTIVVPLDGTPSLSSNSTVSYPVVAKVLSADIAHKTEVGGVVLRIGSDDELEAAAMSIRQNVAERCPDADVDGILVQQMQSGLAEVILGFRRDPDVGPVVVLGVGGTLAELYKDIAIRVAPVGMDEARSMVEEVKGLATIRGYRGMPKGDCEALSSAIVAVSQLASDRLGSIVEAEVNPLLVLAEGDGVVAVDGLVVCQPT